MSKYTLDDIKNLDLRYELESEMDNIHGKLTCQSIYGDAVKVKNNKIIGLVNISDYNDYDMNSSKVYRVVITSPSDIPGYEDEYGEFNTIKSAHKYIKKMLIEILDSEDFEKCIEIREYVRYLECECDNDEECYKNNCEFSNSIDYEDYKIVREYSYYNAADNKRIENFLNMLSSDSYIENIINDEDKETVIYERYTDRIIHI